MEPVALAVREERNVRVGLWIKPGIGVEVDNLRRPDVTGLLDDIHIVVDEEPKLVRIRFVGLHVVRAERRVAAVNWREKDNLRSREAPDIINSTNMSLSKLQEIVKDRETWNDAVHGVTKSQT